MVWNSSKFSIDPWDLITFYTPLLQLRGSANTTISAVLKHQFHIY